MEADIRRFQSKLRTSGFAVIAFGVWTIVRFVLMRYVNPIAYQALVEAPNEFGYNPKIYEMIVFTLAVAILCVDLLLRLSIGCSAIKESQGKKKRMTYVILALLYAVFSVISDVTFLVSAERQDLTLEILSGIIVNLTSEIALFEIVVSSIRLRLAEKGQEA